MSDEATLETAPTRACRGLEIIHNEPGSVDEFAVVAALKATHRQAAQFDQDI